MTRREVMARVKEYRRIRNGLVGLLAIASNLSREASEEFSNEVASWKAAHKRRRLAETSVYELQQEYGTDVKASTLVAGRIPDAGVLLDASVDQLMGLRGIGPVTADRVRAAVNHFASSIDAESVALPDLHEVDKENFKLLRATISQLHSKKLRDLATRLDAQVRPIGIGPRTAIWRLWFLRQAKLQRLHRNVDLAISDLSRIGSLAEDEGVMHKINGLKIMRRMRPEEVRTAWASRSIDYLVLLERELGGVDVLPAGSIPEDLREKIEALELELAGLKCTLRRYQEFGTKFAVIQRRILLGDDMGLGKTIQALAVFEHMYAAESRNRFLVVCPASLIENWRSEVVDKCYIQPHVLHGPERLSAKQNWLDHGGVAITSYPMLAGGSLALEIDLDAMVVDEAHYVKNPDANRTKAVSALLKRSQVVMLMTGTPMENRFNEFAQLLEFVSPGISDGLRSLGFDRRAAVAEDVVAKQIASVYLRRNKEEVLHELPDLIEGETWVRMSQSQMSEYRAAVEQGNFMAMRRATVVGSDSEKYQLLTDIIGEYKESGRKVLVFSYFRAVLDDVVKMLDNSYLLNGSIPPKKRTQIISEFKQAPGHAVLVSQIEVGGVGLNLQEASAVIFMEPQFKPSTEWQALSRAHRMGQMETVVVHRLLARGCIDEILHKLLAKKAALFKAYAARSDTADEFSESRDNDDVIGPNKIAEIIEEERQRLSGMSYELLQTPGPVKPASREPHSSESPVIRETLTQQIDVARRQFWANEELEGLDPEEYQ